MDDLIEKYRPARFEEFLGNKDASDAVRKWALEWERGKRQKPLIITGPCGSGKTTLAMLGAKTHGWEMNFSTPAENRNADGLEKTIGFSTTSSTLFGKKRMVIFEDVDLTFRQDREGVKTMAALAAQATNPVIFTATDFWEQKIAPLRYACTHIELRRLNSSIIAKALEKINDSEKIGLGAAQIDLIVKNCGDDIRAAINDLHSKNTNSQRDREKSIYETTRVIFHSKYEDARQAMFSCGEEHDDIKSWIGWNLPLEFQDGEGNSAGQYARALNAGFESLSRADMFDGRIKKRQYWILLKYSSDLISAGVSVARQGAHTRYLKYEKPPFNYKFALVFGMAKKAARKTAKAAHCAIRDAPWFFPIISAQFKMHPNAVKNFWNFETEELAFVCKSTESTVKDALEKDREAYEKKEKERGETGAGSASLDAKRAEKDFESQLHRHDEKIMDKDKNKIFLSDVQIGKQPDISNLHIDKKGIPKTRHKTEEKKTDSSHLEKTKEPEAKPVKKTASLADFM